MIIAASNIANAVAATAVRARWVEFLAELGRELAFILASFVAIEGKYQFVKPGDSGEQPFSSTDTHQNCTPATTCPEVMYGTHASDDLQGRVPADIGVPSASL